jgi:hypothetical protein
MIQAWIQLTLRGDVCFEEEKFSEKLVCMLKFRLKTIHLHRTTRFLESQMGYTCEIASRRGSCEETKRKNLYLVFHTILLPRESAPHTPDTTRVWQSKQELPRRSSG